MKNSFSLKWSVFGVLVKLFKNVPLYLSVRHKLVKKFDARLLKNYESNGCYGSPPHIIKVKVIKEFVEKYHPKIFVETGTYYGDMVDSVSKNFDKIYPDLSKQYNLPLIPFLLEGVALKPELNLSDGMHPNEKGTIIISNTLQEIILKNISSN